ncbi:MAG: BMP family ABC transporter substrate-binding protein [Faecousia sp.]
MKKILALILVVALMAVMFVGCAGGNGDTETADPTTGNNTDTSANTDTGNDASESNDPVVSGSDVKVGVVLVGDENEGYTYAHILGIQEAVANLGLNEADNIVWKYTVKEDETCYDAIVDCIDQGCTLVFTNSYGHQSFAKQVAEEYPDIEIVAMTGDTAKASGLANFHNAFTEIYEARYAAGVVAGMKIAELDADGKLGANNKDANGNVKVGYVGAYPYAEVVSGYTAFFLGIKSVYPSVVMDVQYTNSWFDITAEYEAAIALIDRGCVIIGQHADSTGAPTACEEKLAAGTTVYSVGYNVDMLSAAPNAALVSPTNEWGVYYTYAIGAHLNGESFDTNWAEGFDKDAVALTTLGPNVAAGTQEKVDEVIAALKDGTLHVFDTSTFTVGGSEVTSAFATDTDGDWTPDADEAVFDGYFHESYFQSAPAFALRIDGITELN